MATKAKIDKHGNVIRKETYMYYVTPGGIVMETKMKQYRKETVKK